MTKKKFYSKWSNQEIEAKLDHPLHQVYDGNSRLYRYFGEAEWADKARELINQGETMTTEVLEHQQFSDPAPAPYTVSILNPKIGNQVGGAAIQKGQTGNYLTFGWQTVNGNGVPLQERVDVTVTFTNNGTRTFKTTYGVGKTAEILIDEYLRDGANEITIVVTGQRSKETDITTIVCNVVAFGLSSLVQVAQSLTPDSLTGAVNMIVNYTAWGGYDKAVEFFVDGTQLTDRTQHWGANHNPSKEQASNDSITLPLALSSGKHTLQIRLVVEFEGEPFYSDTLGYELVVTGGTQQQVTIAFTNANGKICQSAEDIIIRAEQYKNKEVEWGYYTSDVSKPTATVTWKSKDSEGNYTVLGTQNATNVDATNNVAPDNLKFAPSLYGDYTLEAWVGDTILASYKMIVEKNSQNISKQPNAIFEVNAMGRSDNEPEETINTWESGQYKATFHGTHRWEDDACVLEGAGNYVEFDIKPLSFNAIGRGFAMEVLYETFAVDSENAPVISVGNEGEGRIFAYAKRAEMWSALTANKPNVSTRYNNGDKQRVAFIINPNREPGLAGSEPNIIYIQTDGVRERASNYGSQDNFHSDSVLRLGDPLGRCGVKIYSIVIYANMLTAEGEFQNFLVGSGSDITTIIERNDILDPQTGLPSLDKLTGKVDVLKATGAVNQLFNNTDDAQIHVDFERLAVDPYSDITITGMRMTNPGQSTRGFGISQQRGYTDKDGCVPKDYNGVTLYKGYYSIHSGGIPEKKFRLNPQFVDSSMALAATFFHMVNKTSPLAVMNGNYYLRTKAQEYVLSGKWSEDMAKTWGGAASDYAWPYTDQYGGCGILTVPDPIPAVEFWRKDDTEAFSYLSQFTISHEKKSPRTFGQRSIYIKKPISEGVFDPFDLQDGEKGVRGWDNGSCSQFEILQNAEELALFKTMKDWNTPRYDDDGNFIGYANEQVFEQEYPDTDDQTQEEQDATRANFKILCDWFADCYAVDNGGTRSKAKFQEEAPMYLDLPKWADYRIKLLKNMMVDNSVRNMELTTEDGTLWYPKFWDTDIQFGLRNDGPIVFDAGIDRQSKDPDDPTAYAFAGHDSWVWNALEGWSYFTDTLTPMCNQALVNAGWTRTAFVEEFTNFVKKYPERLYNESMQSKYIEQYFAGKDYLPFMKGRMLNYIRYMVAECYTKWDAEWCSGEYASDSIYLRCGGAPNGKKMYFKAAKDFTFGWALTDTSRIQQRGLHKKRGETFEFIVALTGETSMLGVNDPVVIYAPNAFEEIDLHEMARYFSATLQFDKHYDADLGTNLKVLNIGISKDEMKTVQLIPIAWDSEGNPTEYEELPTRNYQSTLAFSGFNTMTRLEVLNVQGLKGIDASRLENVKYMTSLREFYGAGANVVAFEPAQNRVFDAIEFPDTLRSISATNIDWKSLKFFDDNINECDVPSTLTNVYLRNCGIYTSVRDLIIAWANAISKETSFGKYNLILSNVNWRDVSYDTMIQLAKIPRAQRTITGFIELNERLDSDKMSTLMSLYGDDIFSTSASLRISTSVSDFIIGVGGDAYQEDGTWCVLAGKGARLTAMAFPVTAETNIMWSMQGGAADGHIMTQKSCSLDTLTGEITTIETGIEDYDVTLSATDGTQSKNITLRIVRRTYPSSVRIQPIDSEGNELSLLEGQFPINKETYYYFRALFTVNGEERVDFKKGGEGVYGTMKDSLWSYSETDTNRSFRCDILPHHSALGTNEYIFCLRVMALPEDDVMQTLGYWAEFLDNKGHVTADDLALLMYSVFRVIGNITEAFGGNPALYSYLVSIGIQPTDNGYITNDELRKYQGALNITWESGIKSFATVVYKEANVRVERPNVLKWATGVTSLNGQNSQLEGVVDVSPCNSCEIVNLKGTHASINI